jgi:mRNA interferase RelE/StbE
MLTLSVLWALTAVDKAAGFLRDDAAGLQEVIDRVDDLARNPCPDGSTEFGFAYLRRLRVGRYRILYELDGDAARVTVVHLGRLD